jgi:hypothetical protein
MGVASLEIVELIKDLPDDHAMGASGAVFGPAGASIPGARSLLKRLRQAPI